MQAQAALTGIALHELFERLREGFFTVTHKNGKVERYGNGEPQFKIRLNDDNVLGFITDDLLMSLGEAYMDGRVDVEGDLADLMSLALRSGLMSVTQGAPDFRGAILRRAAGLRSLQRDKENISRHYDLGNDFFRLWLDESLTYSCGYFRNTRDTLEQAQQQKILLSLKKLRLHSDETLLDIGCGWGSLVMLAAEHFGAKTTGITLSKEQCSAANAAIAARGLNGKTSVRLTDYGSLAAEGQQFDKIVSIGMIEHVGKEHLAKFIQDVAILLKPGGLALLHLITSVKEGTINRWVEKYIFLGGYLPTLPEIITHLREWDFRIWDVENLVPHYRLTLDYWSERFERVVPVVLEKFDERFVRMWRLYLRVSSAAFREGSVEVHQILVSHGKPHNLPMTREDIYRKQFHFPNRRKGSDY